MKIKLFILMFFMFFFTAFNSLSQPFQFEFPSGLVIETSPLQEWELNQNKTFNFFVYDSQNGQSLNYSDVTCNFLISNELSNENQLLEIYPCILDTHNFKVNIDKNIITSAGLYTFNIRCYTETKGGAIIGDFIINDYSSSDLKIWTCNKNNNWLIGIITFLIIILFILTIITRERVFSIFASLITIMLYLYIGACSPLLLLPILFIGLLGLILSVVK